MGTCYCSICQTNFSDLDQHLEVNHAERDTITLEEFKTHIDKFGPEMILETGMEYLDNKELADLKNYIGGSKFGEANSRTHTNYKPAKRGIYIRGRSERVFAA